MSPAVTELASGQKDSCLCLGGPDFSEMDLTEGLPPSEAWHEVFSRFGVAAPVRVRGDFAVGLIDSNGRTFLAVDRFAIRSMCYRVVGGTLRFAERADQLADASTDIDPQAIFNYLYLHVIPSPGTVFKGVFRVPPGHYVLFDQGKLTVAPYWTPTFRESGSASFEPLKNEFRKFLEDSVAAQIAGRDVNKIGCFLSGGTDSSTVAGMLGRVSGQAAATYSIGFDADGYDEMEFARIASRHFKTEHHEYYVTPNDLVNSIPEVAAFYDQPFGNSSALPSYYCARMARQNGVEKMLAGDGGDELFGGNTRYAKQRVFGWYDKVPGLLRSALINPVVAVPGMDSIPLVKKGISYVKQARVPMPDRMQTYNLLTRLGPANVLTPEFLRQIDSTDIGHQEREVWQQANADSLVNRMLAFDWRYTLAECDLPKVCGTTKLANVDVGFPLLDSRLVDFSSGLPVEYKLKGLKLRWFFKEALSDFLPAEIITKKKQGFGLPFGVWVTQHEGLRDLASESLLSLVERGLVRRDFVEGLLRQHLAEHPGYYGEMVWILMMLEQWLRSKAPQWRLA